MFFVFFFSIKNNDVVYIHEISFMKFKNFLRSKSAINYKISEISEPCKNRSSVCM